MEKERKKSEENYNEEKIFSPKIKSISNSKVENPKYIIEKNSEKTKADTLDSSNNSYKIINYNNKQKEDYYNLSNSNNTNFTNSISAFDLFQKNEHFFIKIKLDETKEKILNLKKNIDKKNEEILSLQNKLKELKNEKINKKLELENLLSNKESYEEIFKNLLNDDFNQSSQINKYEDINILINDLDNCSSEKIIEQIKILFNEFKINYNEYDINEISNEIKYNYPLVKINKNLSQNEIINKFLNEFYEPINKIVKNKIPENKLYLLIKYLIKIISLDKRIQNNFYSINKIYKDNKKEIKEKILELSNSKELLNEKLEEANNNILKLENKINLYSKVSRNRNRNSFKKSSSNKFRKGVLTKETNFDFSKFIPNYSNKDNIYYNYSNFKKNSISKEIKLTSPRKDNNKLIKKLIIEENLNNNSFLKNKISPLTSSHRSFISNSNNHLINRMNIQQSFCFFKFINKNTKKFNPLNNFDISPEILGYIKGFISIDFSNKFLSFIPLNNEIIKNYSNKEKRKKFNIRFDKISNIYIENIMKDIITIYINSLKFYKKCENDCLGIEENISLNKFIHLKEFNNINLDTAQRIKATQNKYFPFFISIFDKSDKFEIIFIDYNEFINWFNGIEIIVKNNRKIKSKDKIETTFQYLENIKKNNSYSARYNLFNLKK